VEPAQTDFQAIAVAQQAELQQLRASNDKATVDAALAAAIGTHPVHDLARGQVLELLARGVQLTTDGQGNRIPTGPSLKPIAAYVAEKLASEEYRHFIRGGSQGMTAAAPYNPGATAGLVPGAARAAFDRGEMNLGMSVAAEMRAAQVERGDPRLDPSQPMGLKRLPGK
jgi:hypothetical protein